MKKATLSHQKLIVHILSTAFETNKSVNYVVKPGRYRKARIRKLMRYSFLLCLSFGQVWLSDDELACALILFPDKKQTTWRVVLLNAWLAFSVIGLSRVFAVLRRESIIRSFHPKEPMCYLWFIGVSPAHQHKGLGSGLLSRLIELYEAEKRPMYLETSTTQNLPWYKKFGFQVFHSIQLTYSLYLLKRPLPVAATV